ncbi:MAG TPA: hypothetical protein VGU90_16025, partial [Terriglobales bacterium]|nr:hypothetical protein [Terriglobales bacterium]
LQRRETCPSFSDLALGPKPKAAEFDLNPPVIMMEGEGPFVISGGSQHDLLMKLHWTSLLFIWAGPIWALWAVWEVLGDSRVLAFLGQNSITLR